MNELGRHAASPAELQEQLIAVRGGSPFLLYRNGERQQRIICLEGRCEVTVGRDEGADVALSWDNQVSRLHAELECIAGQWTVVDDGLSSNGSFVNGERVSGRRRLADGDALRFGRTQVVFRAPARGRSSMTSVVNEIPTDETL
jgi:pSer/pThr/pTyr-binding forkhead associated (FHA) protein